jgi:hypothetical protein
VDPSELFGLFAGLAEHLAIEGELVAARMLVMGGARVQCSRRVAAGHPAHGANGATAL